MIILSGYLVDGIPAVPGRTILNTGHAGRALRSLPEVKLSLTVERDGKAKDMRLTDKELACPVGRRL